MERKFHKTANVERLTDGYNSYTYIYGHVVNIIRNQFGRALGLSRFSRNNRYTIRRHLIINNAKRTRYTSLFVVYETLLLPVRNTYTSNNKRINAKKFNHVVAQSDSKKVKLINSLYACACGRDEISPRKKIFI